MKIILSAFFLLLCFVSIIAQSPQAFNYQGIARDVSGSPLVSKNISLRTSIIRGSSPGTDVYIETHNVVTNKLGIFSVEIGRGSSQVGLFENINWGLADHYIQIEIDPAGGTNYTLLGESQLLSVPYALYSANSAGDNIWKVNGSGIYYNTGNVGIGTSNPSEKLSISGVDATGDGRKYLTLNNQSTSTRSLAWLELSAGQPNSATSLQHISETYDFDGDKYTDFGLLASSGRGIILRADAVDGVIKFLAGGDIQSSPERMRINEFGKVGIGTANPVSRLQVNSGDIYIEDINNGVIMKSPNGSCWRMTINNDGSIKTTAIACPQ